MVDFGFPDPAVFLDPQHPDYRELPDLPPPNTGGSCPCPLCAGTGAFTRSPACLYWRDCGICGGQRAYQYRCPLRIGQLHLTWGPWIGAECFGCLFQWRADRAWFLFALRDPAAAAHVLRDHHAVSRRPWKVPEHPAVLAGLPY